MNNYTPVFDAIFDKALLELSPREFKVFYFIYRKIVGFDKREDKLSLNQIASRVNLCRRSVAYSVKELKKTGWIGSKKGNPTTPTAYHLGSDIIALGGANFAPGGSAILSHKVVQTLHPQDQMIRDNDLKDHQSDSGMYIYLVKNSGNKKMIDDFLEKFSVEEFDEIGVIVNEYLNKNDDNKTPVINVAGYIRTVFEERMKKRGVKK